MVADQPTGSWRRVGVLGGTFDPVHVGHLIIAQEVLARLGLDGMLFVPARVSPFKREAQAAPAEDRVAMLELALQDEPRFRVSRVDLDRPAPSFTVDTLRILHQRLGGESELTFVMGADSLATFAEWRAPGEILRLARLACVTRPGTPLDLAALRAALPSIEDRTDLVEGVEVGISSTDIRRRVAAGEPIRFQVPPLVERYIARHGLYRTPMAPSSHPSCC